MEQNDELERDKIIRRVKLGTQRSRTFWGRLQKLAKRKRYSGAFSPPTLRNFEFGLSEGRSHGPRVLRLCDGDAYRTPFWINLLIACDAPTDGETQPAFEEDVPTSKNQTRLPNALKDLEALAEFFEPDQFGDPQIVFPLGTTRSVGYFTKSIVLANPTSLDIKRALQDLFRWVSINSADPEFQFYQLNIAYSGHARRGEDWGQSSIHLSDGWLRTRDFVRAILDACATEKAPSKQALVNGMFDCCFAAAVGSDFQSALQGEQSEDWKKENQIRLVTRKLLCSSLDDELSFDSPHFGHSLFTAGYLRENSVYYEGVSRLPELYDVSLITQCDQCPIMFDIVEEGVSHRLPLLNIATKEALQEMKSERIEHILNAEILGNLREDAYQGPGVHPIDVILAKARVLKILCKNPSLRKTGKKHHKWGLIKEKRNGSFSYLFFALRRYQKA